MEHTVNHSMDWCLQRRPDKCKTNLTAGGPGPAWSSVPPSTDWDGSCPDCTWQPRFSWCWLPQSQSHFHSCVQSWWTTNPVPQACNSRKFKVHERCTSAAKLLLHNMNTILVHLFTQLVGEPVIQFTGSVLRAQCIKNTLLSIKTVAQQASADTGNGHWVLGY